MIADVEMQDFDGFEILHRLRSDPALKQVPVLALTACAMRGGWDRIMAAGFDGYLSKPIRVRADPAARHLCSGARIPA